MKKNPLIDLLRCLVLVALVASPLGCGGGGGSDDDTVTQFNVTGTWRIVSTASGDLTAVLVHTGTTITGTVSDATNYATSISGSSAIPARATDESRDVSLTVTFNDGSWVRFDGVVSKDNNTISGTYTGSQGYSDPFTAQRQ